MWTQSHKCSGHRVDSVLEKQANASPFVHTSRGIIAFLMCQGFVFTCREGLQDGWIGRNPFKAWGRTICTQAERQFLAVMQHKAASALLLPWEWLPGSVQGQQREQD